MNRHLRKIISRVNKRILPKHSEEDANAYLQSLLNADAPLMVARFGAVEIKAILYKKLPPPFCNLLKHYVLRHLHANAGFFPLNEDAINDFAKLMVRSMKEVDVLAAWRIEEIFFKKELKQSYKMPLSVFPPRNDNDNPWSQALDGKKVLVVHPFAQSIKSQYSERRELLFSNPKILPCFKSLEVIEAVQTAANNTAGFNSWFEALHYMEQEILKKDFDIALLGCGAYGFPLAAFIKGMGKKAVHIGGSLQLLFGIKGKRWDNSGLYNDHWVSPSESERPKNADMVEGACYW